jgi:hypothetical protein
MRSFGKGALRGDANPATEVSQMPQFLGLPDDSFGGKTMARVLI